MSHAITVRLFKPDEWALYKKVRLKALQSDPAVFGSRYAKEAAYGDKKWREDLLKADLGVFGVFDGEKPVGMTGVYISKEDATSAGFWGSWLENTYRSKGISQDMYAARLAWARARPEVKRVVVSHRESNAASKGANRKHGFVFTHGEERTWHDGVTETEHFYELRL